MICDIVLVGVGGQGVLTIADLLIRAAFEADVPATYCPTKGMAQRGGFVKGEVRLGQDGVGSRIGEGQADLVVAMERSEALKGLPFLKPDGTFLLFDHVWAPTGVMLGADTYPERDQVLEEIAAFSQELIVLDPKKLPTVDGQKARPNIYILGAMIGRSIVGEILSIEVVESAISARWPRVAETNLAAFRFGIPGNGA